MKCPKCRFETPVGAKFCNECGYKLDVICLKCSQINPPGSKYCIECGYPLTSTPISHHQTLSYNEKLEKIQRYLPKGLTDKILSQKNKIEGERKQVTVMFCDMEGFTALSEKLGGEEAYSVMDQVYEILIHQVHAYEGTVNEMTGDGIMALFGAPIALEDAPQRGIRAAFAIHREMVKYSDKIKHEKKGISSLKMRIGIHTGPVVMGTLGNDLRVEFKAVGDTVNLASRMEKLAEPGTTYVTQETFKLTEGLFRFEALGEKEVKGKKDSVRTYHVIAPSTRRTRFDVSAERGLTPFVGRGRELELLLDGFERCKTGRGQAFSIIAEAGLGKSRLLYEFRKAVSSENMTFLEGRCLSYSKGVAYHPLIDILKSNFDIEENETDSEITVKVKKGLKVLGLEETSTLPYFLELLSVKYSGVDQIPLNPDARKERIMQALKMIVLKGSEIRPLIMAFEDLHWIDKSSEESAKDLLDSIPGARILLIFTYRPEFVHTWGGKSYHSQLNLNRFSNRESLMMASHLLGREQLDSTLEDLILEKTEGVPFFIEEFLRSMQDLKIIQTKGEKCWLVKELGDVTIPATIQDVIMARVDSLPETTKKILRTGSVIEREFSYRLIERVANLPEQDLLAHLSALKDSELIYERGIYPDLTYVFRHALTREVVYNSLLTSRKRKLHERIGQAIEKLSTKSIDEQCEVLVEHFIRSENYEKGAKYSELAGKKVARAASYGDAIEYAKKRIFCLERLPKTEKTAKRIIDSRTILASYYTALSRLVEAKEAVTPIVDLALDLNYQKRLPRIHTAIGLYGLWVEEDYQKGLRHLQEVSKISETADNSMLFFMPLWFSNYYLGANLMFNGEFERALEHFNKCLNLSRAANDLIGIPFARGVESLTYTFMGMIARAYQISEEVLQMAGEIGGMFVEGMALTIHGSSCYYKGLFEDAEAHLLKGLDYCERTTQVVWGPWAPFSLGHMYFDIEKYEKSKNYYQRGLSILKPGKILPSLMKLHEVVLVRAKVLEGGRDVDLSELVRHYKANKFKIFQVWMAGYIGEIFLNIGEEYLSDAEEWIKKAIKNAENYSLKWFLARFYALYAGLFKRKGDQSNARENLSKAIDIFNDCGADGWVQKYENELAAI